MSIRSHSKFVPTLLLAAAGLLGSAAAAPAQEPVATGVRDEQLGSAALAGTKEPPAPWAAAAPVQPGATTGSALSDRLQIDAGYFGIDSETTLRYDGPQGGSGEVNFEEDLGVNPDASTLWLDATLRLGRRHQLKVSWTRLDRERSQFTLGRSFTWGGETYSAGLEATTTTGTDILGAYYRFALYRNDRFEVGPAIGLGYLWLDAGIRASGTVSGPAGSETRSLDESATLGSATGAIGGYTNAWLTNRLVLRADYLYIKVAPDGSEASVTDWRIGAGYYFTRHVGAGVQYKYYAYSYDRDAFDSRLGGQLRYDGFQVFASFLF